MKQTTKPADIAMNGRTKIFHGPQQRLQNEFHRNGSFYRQTAKQWPKVDVRTFIASIADSAAATRRFQWRVNRSFERLKVGTFTQSRIKIEHTTSIATSFLIRTFLFRRTWSFISGKVDH